VNQYREGKVKRTPVRGVKEYLKPYAYKQWEGYVEHGVRPLSIRSRGSDPMFEMPDRVPFA
jgi:hypothetical protein